MMPSKREFLAEEYKQVARLERDEYRRAHESCPGCGKTNFLFWDEHRDADVACDCGWKGAVHDLIPRLCHVL